MPLNYKLRTYWKEAGYPDEMASACVVRPPNPDLLRVYHITSAEYGLSAIGLQRIKIARFSDINDPFELFGVSFGDRTVRDPIRAFKNKLDKETGLICFSADWKNPLLWSHYGVKHRGICLGFNLRRSLATKVDYQPRRILAKLGDEANPLAISEELKETLMRTKSEHWDYEEERRYFVVLKGARKEGPFYFRMFDEDLELAEVVLGPNCEISLDAVRQFLVDTNPQAVAFRSRLSMKKFEVVPMEDDVPPPTPGAPRRRSSRME